MHTETDVALKSMKAIWLHASISIYCTCYDWKYYKLCNNQGQNFCDFSSEVSSTGVSDMFFNQLIGLTDQSEPIRPSGMRQQNAKKDSGATHTEGRKKIAEHLKSAITDHYKRNNHIMEWDKRRTITSETNKFQRWISEAIEIRKRVA